MSRVLPILFNTDMVKAILREIKPKTVTRRVIKGFVPKDAIWRYTAFTPKGYISCRGTFLDGYGRKFFKLPCQPGDILYVRETWCKSPFTNHYVYRADEYSLFTQSYDSEIMDDTVWKWRPSIHMPKEAARIWLKVKNVRVERLQDITDVGAEKEGAQPRNPFDYDVNKWPNKEHFKEIWNSTIKKSDLEQYGWEANPWVWVIEFERCEKPQS